MSSKNAYKRFAPQRTIPEFDLDGAHFYETPSEQDQIAYATQQSLESHRLENGLCMGCGSSTVELPHPFCELCLAEMQN